MCGSRTPFQPGSLIRETALAPLPALAAGGEPEDLLIGQGVFRSPVIVRGAQLFVGLGAGDLRFPTLDAGRGGAILLTGQDFARPHEAPEGVLPCSANSRRPASVPAS